MRSSSSQKSESDIPVMSSEVTNSPINGLYGLRAGAVQQRGDVVVEDEHLLVLGAAEPVHQHRHFAPGARGRLGEQRFDEHRGNLSRGHLLRHAHPRLAMDAETDFHLAGRDAEKGLVLARHRASGEGHPSRAHARVGVAGERFDIIQTIAARGRRPGALEDVKAARDAAPAVGFLRAGGEHIVGDQHRPRIDAFGAKPGLGHAEVHDVAAVVAEGEENAGAAIDRFRHPVALLTGGRREDVADGRGRGQPLADQSVERRIVPRATADDHRHAPGRRRAVGHHPGRARDAPQIPPIGGGIPGDHLLAKCRCLVEHPLHRPLLLSAAEPVPPGFGSAIASGSGSRSIRKRRTSSGDVAIFAQSARASGRGRIDGIRDGDHGHPGGSGGADAVAGILHPGA